MDQLLPVSPERIFRLQHNAISAITALPGSQRILIMTLSMVLAPVAIMAAQQPVNPEIIL
jgi:hypothetical protein